VAVEIRDVASGLWLWRQPHPDWREGLDWDRDVLAAALAHAPVSEEALYFSADGPPTPELAARWGDRSGTRVHFEPQGMRFRWLDRARRN
jgi:hypothetical protein